MILFELLFAGDGAHFRLFVQRIPDRHLSRQLNHFADKLLGDRPLNQKPAAAVAALSHVKADAKNGRIQSGLQVSIGENDLGIFAAQFEFDLFQIVAGGIDHCFADVGGSGERHHIDLRMRTEPASDRIAITADNVDHSVRNTGFGQNLAEPERGSGGQLARFDDASAAGGERVGEFLANDQAAGNSKE